MKNKIKNLKRLLTVCCLAFVLVISSSNWAAYANTSVDADTDTEETLVIFDEDGSISYQTITPQDTEETISDEDVLVNDLVGENFSISQPDDQISAYASSSLEPVPTSVVTTTPYRYSCLVAATFPNGETYASSGILVGKNVVLGSGHGVYNKEWGGAATSIQVSVGVYYTPSGEFKCQYGTHGRKQFIVTQNWVNNTLDKADWSLILLDQTFSSHQTCGYASDYTKVTGRSLTIFGYPGERFCYSKGQITGTTDYKFDEKFKGVWETSAWSERGMSGGPAIDDATGAVIGVIKGKSEKPTGDVNSVVPLTKTVIDAISTYSD